ncbi:hypothetical protein B0H16DRAFT_1587256 [Mycena metata]|uniref:Argonaute linker 1 domain-containing protein n=1 Tax=Mycena metata TaxID=1033252 RepID=A0AAD7MR41_9AGAR|nr:hypothetical protein B0H16DRAFT_1587256 [Mycena metata]
MTMDLIRGLQFDIAPQIFTPRCVYDGRKNIFSIRELPFDTGSHEFDVTLADAGPCRERRRRQSSIQVYKIKLTKVAQINPEVLKRFIDGDQSHDNTVLTAITALNVVIRMEPTLKYPFNVRSFFTKETKDIGAGLELCKFIPLVVCLANFYLGRGYFQSIRPAMGRMLINVDISTGCMYKHGPLLRLCLEFIGKGDPNDDISSTDVVQLSTAGASSLTFQMREGQTMTVAEYFQSMQNKPLQFPDVICAEVINFPLTDFFFLSDNARWLGPGA